MKNSINFSSVKYYLNHLIEHWEGIYLMPADDPQEYEQETEYYQNIKASIIENDLYEDIQIGFSYLLNNSSINTNQYLEVFDWNDQQIRELLLAAYTNIYETTPLKLPNELELKEIAFKDWWFKTKGK